MPKLQNKPALKVVKQKWEFDDGKFNITFKEVAPGKWKIYDPTTPDASIETYTSLQDCEEQLESEGMTKIR